MDSTRWLQLKDLFRQAFDLPEEERTVFLREHCCDSELRSRVQSLLDAQDDSRASDVASPEPNDRTRVSSADAPRSQTSEAESLKIQDTHIGRYKLLQKIGEGGFGTVYMAEQEQPIRRRVAVKVIKTGMDSREVVARFEQERQALSLMDHPHIARVFDGGQTEAGRPYFAMELVHGVPVTEHCDTHQLNIRQRLELFVRICQAVQHAHQKGVLHRDLKPSNILVSPVDGNPHPKVIDFGIAKAVRERLTDKTLFTNFQQMVGTPQYMSPEQAVGSVDIDTRSDVYSLGIVLYELLTGTTPFDVRRLKSVAEIQRVIREQEPPPPSTRLSTLRRRRISDTDDSGVGGLPADDVGEGECSAIDIARHRHTDTATLVRQLRGEIDWIVLKSLEKDRGRRYESAGTLAADVERLLRNEPVAAGPPSRWYRFRKLIARNRVAFIGVAGVSMALLAGMFGTTIGLVRANDALARVAREAAKARAVQSVLQRAMVAANPYDTTEPDLSVRELLDRTAATLSESLPSQPDVEAAVRTTIGQAYRGLGAYPQAEEQLDRAVTLLAGLGRDDLDLAEARIELGRTRMTAGRPIEAQAPMQAGIDYFERSQSGTGAYAISLLRNGELKLLLGDDAGATLDVERAAVMIAGRDREPDVLSATSLELLGRIRQRQGDFPRAETAYASSVEMLRGLSDSDPDVEMTLCTALSSLGGMLRARGNAVGAIAALTETIGIMERRIGTNHPSVAICYNNLAFLHRELGDLDAAEQRAQRGLDIRRSVFAEDNPAVLDSLTTLSTIQFSRGKFREARDNFQRCIDGRRRAVGENDPVLPELLGNLAGAMNRLGDAEGSEAISTEAVGRARVTLGSEHPQSIQLIGEHATLLLEHRKFALAEPLVREALAGNRRLYGETHALVARDLNSLAMVLQECGDRDGAEEAFRASLSLARRSLAMDHPDLITPICNLCVILNDTARSSDAEPLLREALAIAEAKLISENAQRLRAMMGLGVALSRTHRAAEGEPLLRSVLEIRGRLLVPTSPVLLHTKGALGECLTELGQFEEAEPLLLAAYQFFSTARGATHPHAIEQAERLARLYDAWNRAD